MLQPTMLDLRDDRTETYLRMIRENLNPQTQVVVIIFPTSRDDRYSAVKKLCCVESPVPSQVTLHQIAKSLKDLGSAELISSTIFSIIMLRNRIYLAFGKLDCGCFEPFVHLLFFLFATL